MTIDRASIPAEGVDMASSPTTTTELQDTTADETTDALVESDVLVEEVSIDGMCGVY
jgi:mycofactocin precursor